MLTQPDRPSGRGLKLSPSAVKQVALEHGLALHQPQSLRDPKALQPLLDCAADLLVVAAYGLILPAPALHAARLGAVNIHASLLPRWRGAAPIQRALMAGDPETGVCIMQMDEGLDTGPVLTRHAIRIEADDDAGLLHDRLSALGAQAIVEAVALLSQGQLRPQPQPSTGVTYAHKITREDQELDWRRSSLDLERQVRALRPAPGARTGWNGEMLKVWSARCVNQAGEPGAVLDASAEALVVGCGQGALAITSVQRAGGKRAVVSEFLRGNAVVRGDRFELPPR